MCYADVEKCKLAHTTCQHARSLLLYFFSCSNNAQRFERRIQHDVPLRITGKNCYLLRMPPGRTKIHQYETFLPLPFQVWVQSQNAAYILISGVICNIFDITSSSWHVPLLLLQENSSLHGRWSVSLQSWFAHASPFQICEMKLQSSQARFNVMPCARGATYHQIAGW